MKTYHLQIITGAKAFASGTYVCSCRAAKFKVIDGVYAFEDHNGAIVACYPVDRTIIHKIENHDQVETN
jgi:hypothetical protein